MELDLTKTYPRSVREKLFGVTQLARTIDKAKAEAAGKSGEYNYDCPMDNHIWSFLGMDGKKLLEVAKNAKSDAEIEAWVKPYVDKKSPAEIETFNQEWLTHGPEPGTPAEGYFKKMLAEVAPNRTDVSNWPDLLDLDEKRPVPQRAHA